MRELSEQFKVVICVGTGGVGKTTVSAAIGLAAAASGRRTLVMTIDPARRLANALGLSDFGNLELELSPDLVRPHGVELKAPLFVMMPEKKRVLDDLITSTAPNEATRERILRNRIYQQLSTVLAGSMEYAATEKLYETYSSGRYDLIVLDTPPAQSAVDFLEAPRRVLDFLENEGVRLLVKPYVLAGKFSLKLLDLSGSFVLRTLSNMVGGNTLQELGDFVLSFQDMYEQFKERSRAVRALLGSQELALVLVANTAPRQRHAAERFLRRLESDGLKVRAVVANRVRPPLLGAQDTNELNAVFARMLGRHSEEARAQVLSAAHEELSLAEQDQHAVRGMRARLAPVSLTTLEELPSDVHDLQSLAALHRAFLSVPTEESG